MQILRTFGSLDVLVNCAGWSKFVAHDDFETLDTIFDDVIEHNLITVYKSIRVFSDSFKDDSIIVNISSAAAKGRGGSNIAYAAAKAGVDSLTRNLSAVLGPKTRVVAIAPGFVETAFKRPDQAAVAEVTPLKRVATVNDVSEAVLNVINTKFLNGSSIVLDGGRIV
jgi:3-oxoacyl-[acyl-carrier protein] reductase